MTRKSAPEDKSLKKPAPTKRYRALRGLALRAEPREDCEDFLEWEVGDIFVPPAHMNTAIMLDSGKIEEVTE